MKQGTGYELKRLKRLSQQDIKKKLAELEDLDDNGDLEEPPPLEEEEAAVVVSPQGRGRRSKVAKVDTKSLGLLTRGKVVVRGKPGAPMTLRRSQ